MDLKMYEYPLAIAREGSLSEAARTLSISQSALSHFLSGLEQQLGKPLFDRSTRYLSPTPAGAFYLAAAQKIVDVKRQTYHTIASLEHHYTSTLTIGTTPHNGANVYAWLFSRFSPLYPQVRLVQKEGYIARLRSQMQKGELDFLIATNSDTTYPGCRYLQFARQELLLAVSENHPLAAQAAVPYSGQTASISLPDIQDVPVIHCGPDSAIAESMARYCQALDYSPTVVFRSNNIQLVREMIKSGMGVGILPAVHVHINKGFRYFSLEPKAWLQVGIYCRPGKEFTDYEQHLVALCYQFTAANRIMPHFLFEPDPFVRSCVDRFLPTYASDSL